MYISVCQSLCVALMSFMPSVFCWTANYPCKDTSARSSARVSTIWDVCVRYGTVSRRSSSSHWCSHVSTTVVLYSPASPASSLAPLQRRVQNAAVRLVLNLDRQSHYNSTLHQQLHWLPVKFRNIIKTATLMHQFLHNRCPSYLTDLVEFNTADSQRRQLRSSLTRAVVVKRTRTHFGKRAFSVCRPHSWNSLLPAVRNIDSCPAFRRALKSHLFHRAFTN